MEYDEINTMKDLEDNNINTCKPRYYVGNSNFTGMLCRYFSEKNKAIEYLDWIKEFYEDIFFYDSGNLQYLKTNKLKILPTIHEVSKFNCRVKK